MYYISCMKNNLNNSETLLEQSVKGMLQSKVDMDTSDIFFNFGAVSANKYIVYCQDKVITYKEDKYQECLLEDATNFLDLIYREGITPQDLVDDYNNRT